MVPQLYLSNLYAIQLETNQASKAKIVCLG